MYSEAEMDAMKADIEQFVNEGVDGIVVGCLNPDGTVDLKCTSELARIARKGEMRNSEEDGSIRACGVSVTFHRAFDVARDPYEALEALSSLRESPGRVDRILTSGQCQSCISGKELIFDLARKERELRQPRGISIMPGAGITSDNILQLLKKEKSGGEKEEEEGQGGYLLIEFHASAKTLRQKSQFFSDKRSGLGLDQRDFEYFVTSFQEVRRLSEKLQFG